MKTSFLDRVSRFSRVAGSYLYREVGFGDIVPWWMGLAWRRHGTLNSLSVVMPFNMLFRGMLIVYYWCRCPFLSLEAQSELDRLRKENDDLELWNALLKWKIKKLEGGKDVRKTD